jgi:hypothetical protein
MKLKTATLIAVVGVGTSYGFDLVRSLTINIHNLQHINLAYLIQGALFHVPLLLFLFTLYRKQS